MALPGFQINDLFRMDFRTSAAADQTNSELQQLLGLDYRYQPARMAIGLSLSDPTQPRSADDLLGKPIRGETLLGQEEIDLALWLTLITEHAQLASPSRKQIADLVACHWARGISVLTMRAREMDVPPYKFLAEYALQL